MKIYFSGAAGSVTGSCHLLTVNGHKVLLDCGLYQGKDARIRGNDVFPFVPSDIEYVILSHAHIDHSGRLPMLAKLGFKGKIITTPPTAELSEIMLLDSAHIQEQDAERENKKRTRQGKPLLEPLYTAEDAAYAITMFETLDYGKKFEVFPGFEIRFADAGHMLGSAFTEIFINEEGKDPITFVYSGDVGNHNIPLFKEPEVIYGADFLILESTYGNRVHSPQKNENDRLVEIINSTYERGGNVIIPSFAIGRTQEIIYILNMYAEAGKLNPNIKVYVDSPLAGSATEIFKRNTQYMDEETQEFIRRGDNVFEFPNLFFTESVEDSMMLNATKSGLVIISASGMADAGRVRHHLKHNLWRPECSVCFVGYQAEGTLGQQIQSGKKLVSILGEQVRVEAQIHNFTGLSGHADSVGLLRWVEEFTQKPKRIFLVHGDDDAREAMKLKLEDIGLKSDMPADGLKVDIENVDSVDEKKTVPEDLARPVQTRKETVKSFEGDSEETEFHEDRIRNEKIGESIRETLEGFNLQGVDKDEMIRRLQESIERDI